MALDFRHAMNTISDVVQNRPAPLREFDQIYMKVGDLIIQADFIARRFNELRVVFIGDGDAISLSMMHLAHKKVFDHAPKHVLVLDFDERIVNSINHFARKHGFRSRITAMLYNVCDPLPTFLRNKRDAFYTNPPWGASNEGRSVLAFVQRGIEATRPGGMGALVIADDATIPWTRDVLQITQRKLIESGYVISEMIPGLHKYHLDDAPELTSCCLVARGDAHTPRSLKSAPLPREALTSFYGRKSPMEIRYVRDLSGLNRGKAPDKSYQLVPMDGKAHETKTRA